MSPKREQTLLDLIETLKRESAERSMKHALKGTHPDPIEHNTFWLFDKKIDEETEIYRILSFERLLKVYETGQIGIRQTIKWDDPFENFLLKSCVRDQSANLVGLEGTGIAKLSPGATRSRKALPGKCFRIWKFLRCFANTVELSQTGNFLIA